MWVFANVDHWSAEAWTHVAKTGDRIAALQPVYDAVIDRFVGMGAQTWLEGSTSATTGDPNTAIVDDADEQAEEAIHGLAGQRCYGKRLDRRIVVPERARFVAA